LDNNASSGISRFVLDGDLTGLNKNNSVDNGSTSDELFASAVANETLQNKRKSSFIDLNVIKDEAEDDYDDDHDIRVIYS